jgi:hypothetical protein
VEQLAEFLQEWSPTADALTYCDMTTGPTGGRVSLDVRVREICQRYGHDHVVARTILEARPCLVDMVQRTEERLRRGTL